MTVPLAPLGPLLAAPTPAEEAAAAEAARATAVVLGGVGLLVALLCWVWYSAALSALFRRLGAPTWKAWTPVVQEVELYERGGVPGWSVVYLFVPVVQLWGLALRGVAAHRIGRALGRGAGTTVLAVLLPPVWAGLVGWARAPREPVAGADGRTGDGGRGDGVRGDGVRGDTLGGAAHTGPAPGGRAGAVAPTAGAPAVPGPATRAPAAPAAAVPGLAAPVPAPSSPAVSGPAPSNPAVPGPAVPGPVTAGPAGPGSVGPLPAGPGRDAPGPVSPAPVAPLAPAATPAAHAAQPAAPAQQPAPTAPRPAPPAAQPTAPAPQPAAPVALPLPPTHPAPAAPATSAGTGAPVADPLTVAADAVAADVPTTLGAPRLPVPEPDEAERTVVRPRAVRWRLRLDDGRIVPLERPVVVVGRRPPETDGTTQVVALPDTTRTLSKTHARLEQRDGTWWVTDLGSTNGVVVADAGGAERLLGRGEPAPVTGRVRLGDVGMVLEQRPGRAR